MIDTDIDDIDDIDLDVAACSGGVPSSSGRSSSSRSNNSNSNSNLARKLNADDKLTSSSSSHFEQQQPPSFNTAVRKDILISSNYRNQYQNSVVEDGDNNLELQQR